MKLITLLALVLVLGSCKKEKIQKPGKSIIYVTAQAEDYDGTITQFPTAVVRTY